VTAVASLHRQCATSPASSPLCRIRAGRSSSSHRRLISLGWGGCSSCRKQTRVQTCASCARRG
jgi:hypothetical protein